MCILFQCLMEALLSLKNIYHTRALKAEDWRAAQMLSILSDSSKIMSTARSDTVSMILFYAFIYMHMCEMILRYNWMYMSMHTQISIYTPSLEKVRLTETSHAVLFIFQCTVRFLCLCYYIYWNVCFHFTYICYWKSNIQLYHKPSPVPCSKHTNTHTHPHTHTHTHTHGCLKLINCFCTWCYISSTDFHN